MINYKEKKILLEFYHSKERMRDDEVFYKFTEKYFIECVVKQIVFLGTDFKILCDIGNNKIIHSVIRDAHRSNIDKCKIESKIKLYYNPLSFKILKND